MRTVGMVLVLIGALVLGSAGFGHPLRGRAAAGTSAATAAVEKPVWVQPVLGGIAVAGGLLLLATEGRRD